MPQLEISTYVTQIFWLIVSFLSFWFMMAKIVIPKISETIEERKRKYDDYIRKAEEINVKALDSLQRYEKTLAAAKIKAAEQIAQNERELKEIIEAKEAEINQQLKQKIEESEALLTKQKAEIMTKVEALSKETALLILDELQLSSITSQDIDEVLQQEKVA